MPCRSSQTEPNLAFGWSIPSAARTPGQSSAQTRPPRPIASPKSLSSPDPGYVRPSWYSVKSPSSSHTIGEADQDLRVCVSVLEARREGADFRVPDRELLPIVRKVAHWPVNPRRGRLPKQTCSPRTVFFLELHRAMTTCVFPVRTSPVLVHGSAKCRPLD